MKILFFIFIISSLCFFSCTKKVTSPSVYDLKIVKTKEIILEENDIVYGYATKQLVEIDGSEILILNVNGKKLSFYNIENGKKTHEIATDEERIIDSYYYINKDSIFILYEAIRPASVDRETPGQFQLIDYNGNIKTKFPYNVNTSDWVDKVGIEKLLPPLQNGNQIPIIGNNVFFTTWAQTKGNVGTKEFMENRFPLLLRYNIQDQKFYISELNSFPYIEEGIYYPTSWRVMYPSVSGNNLPLIRYNYSSNAFEWDYENDKLIAHSLKSRLIDTIKPMDSPATSHFNNLECAYSHILYDSYRKLYFAQLYYSEDFYDKTNNLWTVIIANEKFEYMGELYCNERFPSYFTKNHTMAMRHVDDRTVEIDYLELVKTKRDFDSYIDSCKNDLSERKEKVSEIKRKYFGNENNPVLTYLKSQRDVNSENYTVMTVYSMAGCISCNDLVLTVISDKQLLFESLPFYLVITGDDLESINNEIEKFNLKDFKQLVIDSTGIIKKTTIHDGLLNPRLTIVKNGEVEDDAIYESSETPTVLMPKFLSSFEICFTNN